MRKRITQPLADPACNERDSVANTGGARKLRAARSNATDITQKRGISKRQPSETTQLAAPTAL
jgi:hypothetical protein